MQCLFVAHVEKVLNPQLRSKRASDAQWKEGRNMADLYTDEHSEEHYGILNELWELPDSDGIECPMKCTIGDEPVIMKMSVTGHMMRGDDTITTLICPECRYQENE